MWSQMRTCGTPRISIWRQNAHKPLDSRLVESETAVSRCRRTLTVHSQCAGVQSRWLVMVIVMTIAVCARCSCCQCFFQLWSHCVQRPTNMGQDGCAPVLVIACRLDRKTTSWPTQHGLRPWLSAKVAVLAERTDTPVFVCESHVECFKSTEIGVQIQDSGQYGSGQLVTPPEPCCCDFWSVRRPLEPVAASASSSDIQFGTTYRRFAPLSRISSPGPPEFSCELAAHHSSSQYE